MHTFLASANVTQHVSVTMTLLPHRSCLQRLQNLLLGCIAFIIHARQVELRSSALLDLSPSAGFVTRCWSLPPVDLPQVARMRHRGHHGYSALQDPLNVHLSHAQCTGPVQPLRQRRLGLQQGLCQGRRVRQALQH